MNYAQKQEFVEHLKGEFASAKSVILTSYQGIEVNDVNALRAKFREANVEYHTVKNTLAKLALAGTDMEILSEQFSGPVTIAYSTEDAVSPAKIIKDFAKEQKEKFQIKAGFIDGNVLDEAGVNALADLPTKDELRVAVLQLFMAGPIQTLRTLSAGPQEFVMLLEAKKQKDEAA